MTAKILVFAGSLREASWNFKIAKVAGAGAAAAGADVTTIALHDYPMPVFNEDLEASEGLPETVVAFRQLMLDADGFIIGTPEYNGAVTAALKNAIDWASRPKDGESPLACFKGKACGLVAASPGGLGGIRGLPMARTVLSGIGVHVIPTQVAVGGVHEKFDASGAMTDDKFRGMLEGLGAEVARVAAALKG